MRIDRVHIDGQTFILTEGQNVAELKNRIVQAVKTGADFVEFDSIGRGAIAVLVTPLLGVRFETLDRTDEQVAAWVEHPPNIENLENLDIDRYMEHFGE